MGTFNTKKLLNASPDMISGIANEIEQTFLMEGYNVDKQSLSLGGYDISLAKGGIFKSILGMKSALKVKLYPSGGNITIEAGVGIFGQQIVPALIMWYVAWPVLLTQIWGMVRQSKLDDRVISIAEAYIARQGTQNIYGNPASGKFCTGCGAANPADAMFCCKCGRRL